MLKVYERKSKQVRVEEEPKVEIEIIQDTNAICLSDTTYKNGYLNNMDWNEMYHFFQKKEYPVYQQELSSSNSIEDVENDDYEAYANIMEYCIHHIASSTTIQPYYNPID